MPAQDQLEIIKPNGDLAFRTLDPNKGIVNIGSDPQNDIVIDEPGIRPFHAFLDYRQRPARFVILNPAPPSPVNMPQVLPNPRTLELGGYILVFLEGSSSATSAPSRPAPMTSPPPTPDSNTIITTLSASEWVIDVEETATTQIIITNGGRQTAGFVVDVVGLDQSWVTISDPINLNPGRQQVVTIAITPPRSPDSRVGTHQFIVRVTSAGYPEQENLHKAALTINPYYDFAVSEVSPKRQTISWSNSSAQFNISMTNKGNSNTLFQLQGVSKETACKFEFQLPGGPTGLTGQVEFPLSPGEQVCIPIQVSFLSNPLVRFGKQPHHFTITAAMLRGEKMPRSVLGELIQKPLVGPGMLLMMAVAVVILSIVVIRPILEYAPVDLPLIAITRSDSSDKPGEFPFRRPAQATPATEPVDQTLTEENKQLTYEEMFKEIASQHNLNWRILEALAYRESRMNYLAIGKAGDMGLMQVIPSTWNEWASKANADANAPFDPYNNITVGAAYLAYVRDFCAGRGYPESEWMLIAYNWGPSRLGEFWDNGGTWSEIPATQRKYAITIINTAAERALNPDTFDKIYAEISATQ